MDFLYIKAIHIIFVVSWFAALFYIVRLFIYSAEAQTKDEIARPILTNQFKIMQRKLWFIIGWPAGIGATVFGVWLLVLNPALLSQPWMLMKLVAIGLLWLYQLQCHQIYKQQRDGIYKWGSFKLRLFNELATVFLVAIVFLVIVKSQSGLLWGILGTIAFAGIMMLFVVIYRKRSAVEKNTISEKTETENTTTKSTQENN